MLALTLGVILGLFCGVQYARRSMIKNQSLDTMEASQSKIKSTKGPLYEEVELDKHVDLKENISYAIVKKI